MIGKHSDGDTMWLTFDRVERLNAFTAAGYRDLRIALEGAATDDATRVVVLTGEGRAFSVGADKSLLRGTVADHERRSAGEEFSALLDVLSEFRKPLFAAVNGLAVGFGATLLLYCDVILMAATARLRMPFTALGIVPEAGSSMLLTARTRWADAMWAMLSSEWIDAAAAHRMGLAWQVVPAPDLITETSKAAAVVAALHPQSVSATKRLMTAERHQGVRRAIRREIEEMELLFRPTSD